MKKAIALILVLVLSFCLCACGSMQNNSTQDDTENNAANNSTQDAFLNHPLLPQLYGTWELINPDTEKAPIPIPYKVLTINEDQTCVVDGIEGTWAFGNMYGNDTSALEIDIFINGERICGGILQEMGLMAVTENYALCGTTHFNSSNPLPQ